MRAGEYGRCSACEGPIAAARLRALPATALCRRCAEVAERRHVAPARRPVARPVDLGELSNREIEELVRQTVREDPRVDDEDVRIHFRRGVVRLDGTMPTAEAHERLRDVLEGILGLREIVDRIEIGRAPT
jgi:osmotically-inducible protein OsmY